MLHGFFKKNQNLNSMPDNSTRKQGVRTCELVNFNAETSS